MNWSEQQNMAGLSLAVATCEKPSSPWHASLTSCISSSSSSAVAFKHGLLQVLVPPASDATESRGEERTAVYQIRRAEAGETD